MLSVYKGHIWVVCNTEKKHVENNDKETFERGI